MAGELVCAGGRKCRREWCVRRAWEPPDWWGCARYSLGDAGCGMCDERCRNRERDLKRISHTAFGIAVYESGAQATPNICDTVREAEDDMFADEKHSIDGKRMADQAGRIAHAVNMTACASVAKIGASGKLRIVFTSVRPELTCRAPARDRPGARLAIRRDRDRHVCGPTHTSGIPV